jgi:teichuronic acid biosynthesis glycosyltransferase TuaG
MLASVASQTFTDWEHILVDDCSSDDSASLIEKAAATDPRIRLIRLMSNRGPAQSRNVAIEHSRGRFLAFLDADDLWLPQKLRRCLTFIERNECSFAYHAFRYLSADGRYTGALVKGPSPLTLKTLHTRRGLGDCMSIVIDRDKVPCFRFPDHQERSHEDWLAWLWLVKHDHIGYLLPEDLGRYRLSETSRNAKMLSAARKVWHLYRVTEGLSWPQAAAWWLQYSWNSLRLHLRSRPREHAAGFSSSVSPGTAIRGAKDIQDVA